MASDAERVIRGVTRLRTALRPSGYEYSSTGVRVSAHQMRLLRQLDRHDPVMVGELAEFIGVTASTMSLNLKRLEAHGLIARTRDPADRRVVNVTLTSDGEALRRAAPEMDVSRADALLRVLRPEERLRAMEGLLILTQAADRVRGRDDLYLDDLAGSAPHSSLPDGLA